MRRGRSSSWVVTVWIFSILTCPDGSSAEPGRSVATKEDRCDSTRRRGYNMGAVTRWRVSLIGEVYMAPWGGSAVGFPSLGRRCLVGGKLGLFFRERRRG